MNAIVKAVPAGQHGLIPETLDQAMRLAEMMARGKLVPEHLRNPADALMVVELAMRFGMSPFAVAQATSVIQGKLMLEGKLVSAAVHSSGILSGRLNYEFSGEGAARRITISGTIRGETAPRVMTVDLKDAKTTNGMWVKQVDQQLVYFATRAWARRHVPEVMLGVYSPEEFDAAPPFAGTTLEASPESSSPAPAPSPAPKRTRRTWLDELQVRLSAVQDEDALGEVANDPEVKRALETFQNGHLTDLKAMLAATFERVGTAHDEETGEVEEPEFPGDRP